MRWMLTSQGITNDVLEQRLVELLGKPIAEASALVVPTGIYPFHGGGVSAARMLAGEVDGRFADLGWASLGVLELTALPSIRQEAWVPAVREADALLVWGGHVAYLCHWMRESGLAALLPELDAVYLGVSAGSIAVTPCNPDVAENIRALPDGSPIAIDAELGLGLVDVAIQPHLDGPYHPGNTVAAIERWASTLPVPAYALDDDSAVVIDGDRVEVVSAGVWHRFEPPA